MWGRHAAEAVLHSERPIHRVWCTGELRFSTRFMEVLREAKASGVVVEDVSWARLAQICGGAVHQGIVLQTAAASSVTLQDLLARCEQSPEPPLLVAVDGITDPHNLGAIARSAEAFGGHGLVAPQRRNAGLTGSVAKVAAGALEHLPVARVVNLNRSLEELKDAGYTVVGLAGEGGQCVVEIPAGEPLVVVVGSEATGLSHLTRQYCHQIVRIPLRGKTPNLNAAVACGVVLYEIARQRWLGDLHGSMPTPPAPERQPPTAEDSEPEPAPNPVAEQLPEQADSFPTAEDSEPEPAPNPVAEQLPEQADSFSTAEDSEPEPVPNPVAEQLPEQADSSPTAEDSEPEPVPNPVAEQLPEQADSFPTAEDSEPEPAPNPVAEQLPEQADSFSTAEDSEPEPVPNPVAEQLPEQADSFPTAEDSEPEPAPNPVAELLPRQVAGSTDAGPSEDEDSVPHQLDKLLPVAAPASAPVGPDLTWSSSTTDTDLHLAAHVSL